MREILAVCVVVLVGCGGESFTGAELVAEDASAEGSGGSSGASGSSGGGGAAPDALAELGPDVPAEGAPDAKDATSEPAPADASAEVVDAPAADVASEAVPVDAGCGAQQHSCNGFCVSSVPSNGCAASATCAPCHSPDGGGYATCTVAGACDIICAAPKVRNAAGTECVIPAD